MAGMVYSQEPSCRYLTVEHHWPNCKLKTNEREKKEKPLNAARLRPQPAPARRCSRIELIGKPSAAPEENLTMIFVVAFGAKEGWQDFICLPVYSLGQFLHRHFRCHELIFTNDLLPPTPCHGVARPGSPCPHLWVHRRKRGFRFYHFFQMDYDAYDVTQPGFAGFAHHTCGQEQFRHLSAKKVSPKKHWIVLVLMDP